MWYCGFCGVGLGPFSQNVSSGDLGVGVSEGVGCVRDSAMVLKGSRPGLRGRKSCASCSAATWWRAAGGQDRTKGAFGGCQTLTLAVNVNLLRGNCILVMKNGQKIWPKLPETDIEL